MLSEGGLLSERHMCPDAVIIAVDETLRDLKLVLPQHKVCEDLGPLPPH